MNSGYGYSSHGIIKNFKSIRCMAIWAGALGVVQSVAWIGLTIVGILAYNCVIDVDAKLTFGSLIRTVFLDVYFKGNCLPAVYVQYNYTMLELVDTVLDPEQVLIWDCVYLAVAVCWLLASVLIMTALKKNDARTTTGIILTWAFVILCINLMDLALGIIFGIDYGRFNSAAHGFNFNSALAGAVDPNAAELIAAMVASISMMIISFKGFVLWIINVSLMLHMLIEAVRILRDKDSNDTIFMPRKDSDDDTLTTRPPIKAYEEEVTTTATIYNNEAFVPDTRSATGTLELNAEPLSRAARMSTDVSLSERRFRDINAFQQYPPPRYNQKHNSGPQEVTVVQASVSGFPAPDYTPPMSRANQGQSQNGLLRNQRYQ